MKLQTQFKLYLRDIVDNWHYIDTIIFLIILLIYSGFTNPCDSCMVSSPFGDGSMITCKDRFMRDLTFDSGNWVRNLTDSNINFIDGSNQSINII